MPTLHPDNTNTDTASQQQQHHTLITPASHPDGKDAHQHHSSTTPILHPNDANITS